MVRGVMRLHPLLAALPLAALVACSSDGFEVAAQTQSVTYRVEIDPRAALHASPPACAIMPALAPSANGLGPIASMTFYRALQQVAPGMTVVTAGESVARMNAAGVATDWQTLSAAYASSGVLDRERIAKIAKAIGVRHVVLPMFAAMNVNFDDRFSFLGLTIDRTYWTTVDVSLQVWDAQTGAPEWASTGACTVASEVVVATRASLARSLETIWTQMLRDLLEHRTQSVIHVKEPVPAADAADASDAKPATDAAAVKTKPTT
jgi:hypothetical protein